MPDGTKERYDRLETLVMMTRNATFDLSRMLETGQFSMLTDFQKAKVVKEFYRQINQYIQEATDTARIAVKAVPYTPDREEKIDTLAIEHAAKSADSVDLNSCFRSVHSLLEG